MISVTVPIYNEVDSILPLYGTVSAVLNDLGRPWELLLVNDGSTDGSAAVRTRSRASQRRVIAAPHPKQPR